MKRIAIVVLAAVLLSACSSPAFSPTPLATLPAGTLIPYNTGTPTPTRPAKTPIPASPSPTLSPTPFIHKVSAGEVFSAIAARYGLKVEELLAANPSVILSPFLVGQELIIPGSGLYPHATTTHADLAASGEQCSGLPGGCRRRSLVLFAGA